ncbi:MAG: hypothetical protein K8S27_15815 [Candidatus Omnitrophica bacterium]|nr:hypothetical protein [Candidatus Omnitrophota bacterium]
MLKTLLLLLTFLLGIILHDAYTYSFLIKYLLMVMLFFSFIEIDLKERVPKRKILVLIAANILIALGVYVILKPFDPSLAMIAFLTAIAPTATAAPVVTHFMKGKVHFVALCVLFSNIVIALILPFIFLLLDLDQNQRQLSVGSMLMSVIIVILIPLGLAIMVQRSNKIKKTLLPFKSMAFIAWLLLLFLASAKVTHFITQSIALSLPYMLSIAFLTLIICILNFYLGRVLGGRDLRKESSQALGHKNTMLIIWICLTYLNPVYALGPMLYIVWHNVYNTYQISKISIRQAKA